jgi:PAS domain S-box-containing protein
MQSILATIPHGVIQVDPLGKILYGNPAYHRFYGVDDGSLIGTSVFDRPSSAEDKQFVRDYVSRLVSEQPEPTPLYMTRVAENGATVNLRADWSYVLDDDGQVTAISCVVTDVTSQNKTRQALTDSRALIDSYFSTAPVGMALLDAEMRFVKLNSTLADYAGVSVEDHLQKLPSEVLPATIAAKIEEQFRKVLRTGEPVINEILVGETMAKPGETRSFVHSYFPITHDDGPPIGIGVSVYEMTGDQSAE